MSRYGGGSSEPRVPLASLAGKAKEIERAVARDGDLTVRDRDWIGRQAETIRDGLRAHRCGWNVDQNARIVGMLCELYGVAPDELVDRVDRDRLAVRAGKPRGAVKR